MLNTSASKKIVLKNGFEMHCEIHAGLVPMDTIVMHGNLASNRWFDPAVEVWRSLKKPGHEGRLILAEWRGCGDSAAPKSEAELHPRILGEDYVQLLEALGVRKANIVAHSTGGLIGLYAMLAKPELFARAALLDPVSAQGVQFEQPMYDAFTAMSKSRDMCAAVIGATIYKNDATKPLFAKLVDDCFRVAPAIWHGVPKNLHTIDIRHELKNIHQPVLVMHGEFDDLLPRERNVEMAKLLPLGDFYEIKGHGHSTNVEDPVLFVELVNRFLFQ